MVKPSELKVGQIIEVTTKFRVTSVGKNGAQVVRLDIPFSQSLLNDYSGPDRTIRVLKSPPRELKRGDVLVYRGADVGGLYDPEDMINVYGWRVQTDGKEVAIMSDLDVHRAYKNSSGVLAHWTHEDGSDVLVTD